MSEKTIRRERYTAFRCSAATREAIVAEADRLGVTYSRVAEMWIEQGRRDATAARLLDQIDKLQAQIDLLTGAR
jgi:hypothetical protein